jgi:hypothetical protein
MPDRMTREDALEAFAEAWVFAHDDWAYQGLSEPQAERVAKLANTRDPAERERLLRDDQGE